MRPGRECRYCGEARLSEMKRKRGDIDDRQMICKSCRRAQDAAYKEQNRDRQRAYDHSRYHGNLESERERHRLKHRARRAENLDAERERTRTQCAAYAARTDAEIKAKREELRPDGTKRCRKCGVCQPFSAFHAGRRNPDGLQKTCRACRNDLLRIASPRWFDEDLYSCVYCGAAFEDVEHVWPSSDGGPDRAQNLVPSCVNCNRGPGGKFDRPVLDFVESHPALGPDVLEIVSRWHWRVVDLDETDASNPEQ